GRLRHGPPERPASLRHRPAGVHRFRLRHGSGTHLDAAPRHRGHARHGRGRYPLLTARRPLMPHVTVDWLREHVEVPPGTAITDVAAALVRVGLEEEEIHTPEITGPVVVGRVREITKEEHSNGKTIAWCQVDVGEHNPED